MRKLMRWHFKYRDRVVFAVAALIAYFLLTVPL